MNYHILTLFPEMVMGGLKNSIIGRAMEKGLITAEAVNIRDYSSDRHHHVDDYPYGGGAGMVMQPGPVVEAYEALSARIGKRPRVIYMTPQGRVFTQKIAEELAREEELVFLCGHYEGIDERALELIVTDYLSVGDYVLTGGELPAMVMIDCISRLVPGVLNNDESAEFESFHDNLLEYPQYTRPEEFRGKRVPEVLLKGDHKKIEAWRREQSIRRTMERRPELMEGAVLTKAESAYADGLKRGMEKAARASYRVLSFDPDSGRCECQDSRDLEGNPGGALHRTPCQNGSGGGCERLRKAPAGFVQEKEISGHGGDVSALFRGGAPCYRVWRRKIRRLQGTDGGGDPEKSQPGPCV